MKYSVVTLILFTLFSNITFPKDYLVGVKSNSKKIHNSQINIMNLKDGNSIVKISGIDEKELFNISQTDIRYITPDYTISIASTPNDPEYSLQWGFENTGDNYPNPFAKPIKGVDVEIREAWDISSGSKNIIIAVIDTGVDYTHEDLKQSMWVNKPELNGVEGIDDDGNGLIDDIYGYDFINNTGSPMDEHGHGTHCAGSIGATRNNGVGISGVIKDASIMALRFLDKEGYGETSDAIRAIDYAIKMKAKILNLSWGGGDYSPAFEEALQNAMDAGITIVAAAGNKANDNDLKPLYPASYPYENIISVGTHGADLKLARFTNFGKSSVDIFAPGRYIYSTLPGNQYGYKSGTSMSTPIVTGAIGLLLSEEPNLSPSEIRTRVIDSALFNEKYIGKSVSEGRLSIFRLLSGK